MFNYDFAVVIGRFQPIHNSHSKILNCATVLAQNVIVVLGSLDCNIDEKNPWTYEERKEMILLSMPKADRARFHFVGVRDYPGKNSVWLAEVQNKVSQVIDSVSPRTSEWSDKEVGGKDPTVVLIGYKKDHSSEYLDWFPQWTFTGVPELLDGISATDLRMNYFFEDLGYVENGVADPGKENRPAIQKVMSCLVGDWREHVAPGVEKYLTDFKETERFKHLQKEFRFNVNYKAKYEVFDHEILHTTVDVVVEKCGHFVCIVRKKNPGKGCFALPGGHVNANERLIDAAIRELIEETSIKLDLGTEYLPPIPYMRAQKKEWKEKYLKGRFVNDEPDRSRRGRVITHCFHFKLPDEGPLPKLRGADDAQQAFWMPYGDVERNQSLFFEDHPSMILHFRNK